MKLYWIVLYVIVGVMLLFYYGCVKMACHFVEQAMRPPRLEGGALLSPITVRDGDPCHVTVTVAGIPIPDITWFHGSREIKNCPDFRVDDKGTSCTLHIAAVTEALSARGVRVVARNRVGVESRDVDLKVYKVHTKWRPTVKSESFSTRSPDTFFRSKHRKMRNVQPGTSMTSLNRDAPTRPSRSMSVGAASWSYGHASHSTDSILDEVFCFDRKSAFATNTPCDMKLETISPQRAAKFMSLPNRKKQEILSPSYKDIMTDSGFTENMFRFRSSEADDRHIEVRKAPPLALPEVFDIEPSDVFSSINSPIAGEKLITPTTPKEMIYKPQEAPVLIRMKKPMDEGTTRDDGQRLSANGQIWLSDKKMSKPFTAAQNVAEEPVNKQYMSASQEKWETKEKVKRRSLGVQFEASSTLQTQAVDRPLDRPNDKHYIKPGITDDEPDNVIIPNTGAIIKKKNATIPKRTRPVSETNLDDFAASIPLATTKVNEEMEVIETIMTKKVSKPITQGKPHRPSSSLSRSRGLMSTINGVSNSNAAISGIIENNNNDTKEPEMSKLPFTSEKGTSVALLGLSGKNNEHHQVLSKSDVHHSVEGPSFHPNGQVPSQHDKVDELNSVQVLDKLSKALVIQASIELGKKEPKRKISPSGQGPAIHLVYPNLTHSKDNINMTPEVYSVRVCNKPRATDARELPCVKVLDKAISYIYAEAFAHFADTASDVSIPLAKKATQTTDDFDVVVVSQMCERPYVYKAGNMLSGIPERSDEGSINMSRKNKQNFNNNNRNVSGLNSPDIVLSKGEIPNPDLLNDINTNSNNHHDSTSGMDFDPLEVIGLVEDRDNDSMSDQLTPLDSDLCCEKDHLLPSALPCEKDSHNYQLGKPTHTPTAEGQKVTFERLEVDEEVLNDDTDPLDSCLCCHKNEPALPSLLRIVQQDRVEHYRTASQGPMSDLIDPFDSCLCCQKEHPSEMSSFGNEDQQTQSDDETKSSSSTVDSPVFHHEDKQDKLTKDRLLEHSLHTDHFVNSDQIQPGVYIALNSNAESTQHEAEVRDPISVDILNDPTESTENKTDHVNETEQEYSNMTITAIDANTRSIQQIPHVSASLKELEMVPNTESDIAIEELIVPVICNNTSSAKTYIANREVPISGHADQVESEHDTDVIQNEARSEDGDSDSEETATTVIEVNDEEDDVPNLAEEELVEELKEVVQEIDEANEQQEKEAETEKGERSMSITTEQFAKILVEQIIIDSMKIMHSDEQQQKQIPNEMSSDVSLSLDAEDVSLPPAEFIAIDVHGNTESTILDVNVDVTDVPSECMQDTVTEPSHAIPVECEEKKQDLGHLALLDLVHEVLIPEDSAPSVAMSPTPTVPHEIHLSDVEMDQLEAWVAELLTDAIDIAVSKLLGQNVEHSIQELVIDTDDANLSDRLEDMEQGCSDEAQALRTDTTLHSNVCEETAQIEYREQQSHGVDSNAYSYVNMGVKQGNGPVSDEEPSQHIYTIQTSDEIKNVAPSTCSYDDDKKYNITQYAMEEVMEPKVSTLENTATIPMEYIQDYIQDIIGTAVQIVQEEERMREAISLAHSTDTEFEYDYATEMDDLYAFSQSLLSRSLSAISEESEPPESDDEVGFDDKDDKEMDMVTETFIQIDLPGHVSNIEGPFISQDEDSQGDAAEESDMGHTKMLDENINAEEGLVPSTFEPTCPLVSPISSTVVLSDVSLTDNENTELELSWDDIMGTELALTEEELALWPDSITSMEKQDSETNTALKGGIEGAIIQSEESVDWTELEDVVNESANPEMEIVLQTVYQSNNRPGDVVEELAYLSKIEPEAVIAEVVKSDCSDHLSHPDSVPEAAMEGGMNSMFDDSKFNPKKAVLKEAINQNEAPVNHKEQTSNTDTDVNDTAAKTEIAISSPMSDLDTSSIPEGAIVEAACQNHEDSLNQITADTKTKIHMEADIETFIEKLVGKTEASVQINQQDTAAKSEPVYLEISSKISNDQSLTVDSIFEEETCQSKEGTSQTTHDAKYSNVTECTLQGPVVQMKGSVERTEDDLETTPQSETLNIIESVVKEVISKVEEVSGKGIQDVVAINKTDSSTVPTAPIYPSKSLENLGSNQPQSAETITQSEQISDKDVNDQNLNSSAKASIPLPEYVLSVNEASEEEPAGYVSSVKEVATKPKPLTGALAEVTKDADAAQLSTARVLTLLKDNWGAAAFLFLAVTVMCLLSWWDSADN